MDNLTRFFAARRVQSIDELFAHATDGWLYRGHQCADWEILSSFDRCCRRHQIASRRRVPLEEQLRREFRRAYHDYAAHYPGCDNILEWLSLMQHYGAPTPLVDFTYSIYIATYFATERSTDDAAVWAVDPIWLIEQSSAILTAAGADPEAVEALNLPMNESLEPLVNSLFFDALCPRLACPVNPFRLNERLRTQRGAFVAPGDIQIPFMENLRALSGHRLKSNIVRVVIPKRLITKLRANLHSMGLSRRTLFPGLDGYSASLAVYHPTFDSRNALWNVLKLPPNNHMKRTGRGPRIV